MTTIHANATRDDLRRLEMMMAMAGLEMPMWVIRKEIAQAITIVVQAARLSGGARKVVKISEVTGMEGDTITMHDLFVFKQTGLDKNRLAQGYFHVTGMRPKCLERLEVAGARVLVELFERRIVDS